MRSLRAQVLSAAAGQELLFFDANNFSALKTLPMARDVDCVAYAPHSSPHTHTYIPFHAHVHIHVRPSHARHPCLWCVSDRFHPGSNKVITGSEESWCRVYVPPFVCLELRRVVYTSPIMQLYHSSVALTSQGLPARPGMFFMLVCLQV